MFDLFRFFAGIEWAEENTNYAHKSHLKSTEYIATVEEEISPLKRGRVRFQGSFWFAQCQKKATFQIGEKVRIIGRNGITLLVDFSL